MTIAAPLKQNQPETIDMDALLNAARDARGLAMDAVAKCKSGHLGLPLGAAEIGAALFGHLLNFDPEHPNWLNRDRFVLSAGHGSMFLYAWLHLAGYRISLQDVKNFRALHSITPGHPEFHETPGVECTTGPLGQGVANSVGMACSAKMAQARYGEEVFNNRIICLAGDGCLQEGISYEALAFASRNKLDNLILIYDSNDVTLDAMASKTQCESTELRFKALDFDIATINGHSIPEFVETFSRFRNLKNGRPKIIIAKTIIGKGIAEVEATNKAHGEAGVKFVDAAKAKLGLPATPFYVADQTRNFFAERKKVLANKYNEWTQRFAAWSKEHSELAKELVEGLKFDVEQAIKSVQAISTDKEMATRSAGTIALNALAKMVPTIVSGSADLHGSTKNYIADGSGDFEPENLKGRNIYFGIREHAMGAIVNGFGYHGLFQASGSTFLTFSDYMRPAIRLAALSKLPIFHIFTHDSLAVGEDGPTHQPIEHIPSLRIIPNLDVIRPGDAEETVGAFIGALERKQGPTAICLSRQDLPVLSSISVEMKRKGTLQGAYIAHKETVGLALIIIATGSELHLALNAVKQLPASVRVVSMPCAERFERQTNDYKEAVLPSTCTKRLAVEAAHPTYWSKYVGTTGHVIGVDHFGLSAPAKLVLSECGITEESVVKHAQKLLSL